VFSIHGGKYPGEVKKKTSRFYFYRCTVQFGIYEVPTPTNALFIKVDEVLKFT